MLPSHSNENCCVLKTLHGVSGVPRRNRVMKVRVALLVTMLALLGGCSGGARTSSSASEGEGSGADLDRAEALLDDREIPAAVEPLQRAATGSSEPSRLSREEVEYLLTQAEAASRDETAEARIAEMKDPVFEAYVERGELPRVPYFHDPRIDGYFRRVLLSKRAAAREIRARRRGR